MGEPALYTLLLMPKRNGSGTDEMDPETLTNAINMYVARLARKGIRVEYASTEDGASLALPAPTTVRTDRVVEMQCVSGSFTGEVARAFRDSLIIAQPLLQEVFPSQKYNPPVIQSEKLIEDFKPEDWQSIKDFIHSLGLKVEDVVIKGPEGAGEYSF